MNIIKDTDCFKLEEHQRIERDPTHLLDRASSEDKLKEIEQERIGDEIDYISDIHLDFYIKNINNVKKIEKFIKLLKPNNKKALIIAGDIGHYNSQNKIFLSLLKEYYENILFTFGNHDLYLISKEQNKKYEYNSFNRLNEMEEFADNNDGIFLLNGDVITIDNIKIGGLPGWYELKPSDLYQWKQSMNDAVYIKTHYPIALPYSNNIETGFDTILYWESQLERIKEIGEVDILFSHIAMFEIPKNKLCEKYKNSLDNIFFFRQNGGTELLKTKNYIFGHLHSEFNFSLDNIQIACNPLGYPHQAPTIIKTLKLK
jgi:UDP-2,3-diacylglucosamine pyrophosphatase LpxH